MVEPRLAYLAACAAFLLLFWDAPVKAWRVWRGGWGQATRGYHLANAAALAVGGAWGVFLLVPAWDVLLPWHERDSVAWVGVAVAWGAVALGVWARVSLGRAFAPTVAVVPGQGVATRGPHRWVRHPFYSAAWLLVASGALAVGSAASLAAALLLVWPVRVLARREERVMADRFASYEAYAAHTGRFLPRWR